MTRHPKPVATMAGSVLAFDRPFDPIPGVWTRDGDTRLVRVHDAGR
jgi:hypothetical protein